MPRRPSIRSSLSSLSSSTPSSPLRRLLCGLMAAALAGCASLPRIVPDMAQVRDVPVQVADGRGPLSAQRSKAVLDALKAKSQDSGLLERHLAIEQAIVGAPLVAGNRVKLLQDGESTYAAMLSAIRAARDHVNLETYIFESDEVGRRFADALLQKQRDGVQVNLVYDSVGGSRVDKAFFEPLTDAGVRVLEFNPVNPLHARTGWDVNQRDHRKLLIVDGRTAFLGGVNISGVYSSGSVSVTGTPDEPDRRLPWRDTHLQIDGPVVHELQTLFMQTWEKQRGDPLPARDYFPALQGNGPAVVRAIGSSPDEPFSLFYATLISAISNAEKEVLLTNAYFVPDPQLRDTLKQAAARGVDVKLILPGSSDNWLVFHAGRSYYDEMLEAGVHLYERKDALLHAKTAVIDGVWSTVGSTNLDWRSFLHNQELNAVVLGADFASQMRSIFDRDLAASREVRLDEWRQRSVGLRLREQMARLWQYWL